MPELADSLISNLHVFVAFARNRLGDQHLAEDVVQESLVKALAADRQPEGEEATTQWFYRILRRSIIDVYRRQGARSRALERFKQELPEMPTDEDERVPCQCFNRLLRTVPGQHRAIIPRMALQGEEPAERAAKLGLTKNNVTVRLHRARKHLREALSRS